MSFNFASSKSKSSVKVINACKACVAAGKTTGIMHLLKDDTGILCPMLLSQKCKWCDDNGFSGKDTMGHTPKYCVKKAAEDKKIEREQRKIDFEIKAAKAAAVKTVKTPTKSKNVFDMLGSSSEDEDEAPKVERKLKIKQDPVPDTVPAKSRKLTVLPKKVEEEQYPALPVKAKRVLTLPAPKVEKIAGERVMDKEAEKERLGNLIYYKVEKICPSRAGKITGMFLDGYSSDEIYDLSINHEKLTDAVENAVNILESIQKKEKLPKKKGTWADESDSDDDN